MSQQESNNSSRYCVGIDLGTTHCVLSYIDNHSDEDQPSQQILAIPQLTTPGSVEDKNQLPSFMYQAHDAELSNSDIALPWNALPDNLVGTVARELGSKTPIRLISSAKSWLCHSTVDPRSAFLPLNSPEEVEKTSPLAATTAYLQHLCQAWDAQHSETPLIDQHVTITVPASFDPAARDITVEAANQVGFKHLTLLEEPQAAVYSWLNSCGDNWRKQVSVGDIILVVDIGGGTTDLSLVAVTEDDGNLSLNRLAVGDHILLGGDNMDLALAYRINAKLSQTGKKLQAWQIQAITHSCRDAKEALLADPDIESVAIVVPSRGSKLLSATLRTELTQEEVQQTLIEGFFPQADIGDQPIESTRGALTQLGLAYAQDAGISRHLAAFLSRQHAAANEIFDSEDNDSAFIKPTAIILNGGVLKAPALANRLLAIINGWLLDSGADAAKLLEGLDLDLAVARGAAYYGHALQGNGVRIRGGTASAYYVGIESSMPAIPGMTPPVEALCVAAFGMEEGSAVEVPGKQLGLVIGEPVNFRFFGSTVRRDDRAGTLLEDWEPDELEELPDIQANLPVEDRVPGSVVAVHLAARINELGTLCLEAIPVDGSERWQVEFDVREAS